MENHTVPWENSLQIAIVNGYVELPGGAPQLAKLVCKSNNYMVYRWDIYSKWGILVGGLEHELYFSSHLGNSLSQLTFICFRGVGLAPIRCSIN